MTVSKNHEGAYVISQVVSGYLITKRYYGYTKSEAVAMFTQEVSNA
jgi:hypothetical protein